MKLKKLFLPAILALLFIISTSCSTFRDPKDRKLSKKEKKELIEFARGFLLNSKIKFSSRDRLIIDRVKPEIGIYYTGYKEGRVRLRWKISDKHYIIVNGKGEFLSESCYWTISVVNSSIGSNKKQKFYQKITK